MLTTESYLFICKQIGLSIEELEYMTVGSVIDYAHTWADEHSKDKKTTRKKATQSDFDAF